MLGLLICCLGIIISAVSGALLGKKVRAGIRHPLWTFLPSVVSTGCWAWLAKYAPISLASVGVLFEIVYGFAYYFTLFLLGEPFTKMQALGIVLCTVGTFCLAR